MFTGPEPVLGCDLTNGHNTLGNICCDAPRDNLTHRTGKESELSFHILYERDALATLKSFLLSSGKLNTGDIRKINPRSILAFRKAVGLR